MSGDARVCVQDAVQTITQSHTTIVIAHRLSTVQSAHQIVYMEAGQSVETGSPGDLLRYPEGRFASMFHRQIPSGFTASRPSEMTNRSLVQETSEVGNVSGFARLLNI